MVVLAIALLIAKSCTFLLPNTLGLAKMTDAGDYTIYPRIMGTLQYMAPEQLKGEAPKKNTDLWALGIILYILISKKHPFLGPAEEKVDLEDALDLIHSDLPPLPENTPEILQVLVSRFLSIEPYQRGSAKRALRDLEEVIYNDRTDEF